MTPNATNIILSMLPSFIALFISDMSLGFGFFLIFPFLLMALTLLAVSGLIPFAWNLHPYFGIVYAGTIYLTAAFLCLDTVFEFWKRWSLNWLGNSLFIAAAINLIILVSWLFLPIIQARFLQNHDLPTVISGIDLEFIDASLKNIQQSLSVATESIKREQKTVEGSATRLINELENRNSQLKKLNEEQQLLRRQIEKYKALASLTEKQAEAVRLALERNKYIDYVVGLIIGIISSGLVSIAIRTRIFEKARKDIRERARKRDDA